MSTHLLERLRAEALLKDQLILTQISALKEGMIYKSDNEVYSLSDFFELLRKDASKLDQVQLTSSLAPGTEQDYLVQLLTSYEHVLDQVERQIVRAIFFAGKLKSIRSRADNLSSTFVAWYLIALTDQVKEIPSLKLTAAIQKSLAESEFSRLIDGADQDLEGMLEATQLMTDMLKGHKKLASEKYNMGKDQVNAALSSLGTDGYSSSGAPRFVRKPNPIEEDDDEAPVRFRGESPKEDEITEGGVTVATREYAAADDDDADVTALAAEAEAELAAPAHEEENLEPEAEIEPEPEAPKKPAFESFEDEDVTDLSEPEPVAGFEDDDEVDVTKPHEPTSKKLDPKPATIVGEVAAKDLPKQKLQRPPVDDDDEDVTAPPPKKTVAKAEALEEKKSPAPEKVPALFTPRRPAPAKSFTDDEDLEGVM